MMDRKTSIAQAAKAYGGNSPMITKFFTLGAEWADNNPIIKATLTKVEDEATIVALKAENEALKSEIEKLKSAKPKGGRGKKAADAVPSDVVESKAEED